MESLPSFIRVHMDKVHALCLHYGVLQLSLFGSAMTDRFDQSRSDLDFLVEFSAPDEPGIASRYMGLAEDLESLFQRPVDLVTKPSVRNSIFKEQLRTTSHSLYAA